MHQRPPRVTEADWSQLFLCVSAIYLKYPDTFLPPRAIVGLITYTEGFLTRVKLKPLDVHHSGKRFIVRTLALILFLALSFVSGSAFAASYQMTNGTVVDSIQNVFGGNHSYAGGTNLQPGADLTNAGLTFADLTDADLANADLSNADLFLADLTNANLANANLANANLTSANLTNANLFSANPFSADLFSANLSGADLSQADLSGAYLTGADLSGATLANTVGLGASLGSAIYDTNTDFTNAWADGSLLSSGSILFDPVAAGWTLVPIPVPEPGTALLIGLGLAGLTARRR